MRISGKKIIVALSVLVLAVVFYILIGWKLPVYYRINSVNLPTGCEKVCRTEVIYSDAYSLPCIKGEKTVKYEGGYEEAVKYIEENNSEEQLENISVSLYLPELSEGLSSFGKKFTEMDLPEEEAEKYISIVYYKAMD